MSSDLKMTTVIEKLNEKCDDIFGRIQRLEAERRKSYAAYHDAVRLANTEGVKQLRSEYERQQGAFYDAWKELKTEWETAVKDAKDVLEQRTQAYYDVFASEVDANGIRLLDSGILSLAELKGIFDRYNAKGNRTMSRLAAKAIANHKDIGQQEKTHYERIALGKSDQRNDKRLLEDALEITERMLDLHDGDPVIRQKVVSPRDFTDKPRLFDLGAQYARGKSFQEWRGGLADIAATIDEQESTREI